MAPALSKVHNQGLKKLVYKSEWKDEKRKQLRTRGEEYVNRSNEVVPGKTFEAVTSCCKNQKCYRLFEVKTQEALFKEFYIGCGSKQLQDIHLSSCLIKRPRYTTSNNATGHPCPNQWAYVIIISNVRFDVCRKFILKLFQITDKRIRCIQKKLINGNVTMTEGRGKHDNRPHCLDQDVDELFIEHLNSIPNKESHYSPSKRKYFSNPNLDIVRLYKMFREYYFERTGKNLKMEYLTYLKKFQTRSPISFSHPKTDKCNYCEEFELLPNPTESERQQHSFHVESFLAYSQLKKTWLSIAKNDDTVLVIEFDYAQNHPIPKLNINEQFYKRLFWMYVFNIHTHGSEESKMYVFPEGCARKDSSSVVTFLFDFLQPILEKKTRNSNSNVI